MELSQANYFSLDLFLLVSTVFAAMQLDLFTFCFTLKRISPFNVLQWKCGLLNLIKKQVAVFCAS